MECQVFTLNAFGLQQDGGNPAGVVIDADWLTEEQMQRIAAQVGLSETAFVLTSENCDYRVRFFTPSAEVDLCGHATIATYSLLFQLGKIKAGKYWQELKAGRLDIEIAADGRVSMQQLPPVFGEILSPDQLQPLFNVESDTVFDNSFPIQAVSTGLPDIFVAVRDRTMLDSINPNFAEMAVFNQKTNTVGFHLFCLSGENLTADAYCRNFAPRYQINEEAATGSASGALACYLYKYWKPQTHFEFEQGWSMKRPSRIIVELEADAGLPLKVVVSGYAGQSSSNMISC